MKTDSQRKKLLRVLAGEAVQPAPLWLMRQAGRYLPEYHTLRAEAPDFIAFCLTPKLAVEASLQPVRRFGLDAAIIFSDILLVPFALGQDVHFDDTGPHLQPVDARFESVLDGRRWERLAPVYEAIDECAGTLDEATALIGFAGAPWTLATYMVGGGARSLAAERLASEDALALDALCALLADAVAEHLIAQVKAGADVLHIFDTAAGTLAPPLFARFCTAPTRMIVRRVKEACPAVPIIGFPKGVGVNYEPYFRETGLDGIAIDAGVSLDWARDTLQPLGAVQGNLDPVLLRDGGAPMLAEATRIMEVLGGGAHIFSLGHGVLPDTPPDHVRALIAHVRGNRQ